LKKTNAVYHSKAAKYCTSPPGSGAPTEPKPKAPVDPKPLAVATPPHQEAVTPEITVDPKPSKPLAVATPPHQEAVTPEITVDPKPSSSITPTPEQIVSKIFFDFDIIGKGYLDKFDIGELLYKTKRTRPNPTLEQANQIFKILDKNDDGKVERHEFFKAVEHLFKQNN